MTVGSLRGKDGEVVNMAVEGHLDFCCLNETRWRVHLRDPELSLNSFKTKLKTHFFPDPTWATFNI